MDFTTQIKMMQAIRGLNDSQTAELFGTTRQNYSRKIKKELFLLMTFVRLQMFLDLIWKLSLPTEKAVRKFKNYKENLLEVSVEQAEKVGYEPCKICIGE